MLITLKNKNISKVLALDYNILSISCFAKNIFVGQVEKQTPAGPSSALRPRFSGTCSGHLCWRASGRHPDQMAKPPQMAPFKNGGALGYPIPTGEHWSALEESRHCTHSLILSGAACNLTNHRRGFVCKQIGWPTAFISASLRCNRAVAPPMWGCNYHAVIHHLLGSKTQEQQKRDFSSLLI